MIKISDGLNFAGGCADRMFLLAPKILKPLFRKKGVDKITYQAQVDFYIDQGFVDDPKSFFSLPEKIPQKIEKTQRPYFDGVREVISWQSGYKAKNPLLRYKYDSYIANRTAYLLRWTHQNHGAKTVVCLHGFMLGEPNQAEKMFKIKKLYEMGLDVALFIAPFHWKRAPGGPRSANMAIQPDNVAMTCEFFGQTIYDLFSAHLILKNLGAGKTGLIGASMGGYNAALFSCLADVHSFAAMMVPVINFSRPMGPDSISMPYNVDKSMSDRINKVWQLHSPLNFEPIIPKDKILIIASKGDGLCLFEYVEQLCKKWDGIRHCFMTGGHWLIFNPRARGKAWYAFLKDMGFV